MKNDHLTVDSYILSIWVNTNVYCLLSDMHKVLYNWNLTMLNFVFLFHLTVGYIDQFAVKYTWIQIYKYAKSILQ